MPWKHKSLVEGSPGCRQHQGSRGFLGVHGFSDGDGSSLRFSLSALEVGQDLDVRLATCRFLTGAGRRGVQAEAQRGRSSCLAEDDFVRRLPLKGARVAQACGGASRPSRSCRRSAAFWPQRYSEVPRQDRKDPQGTAQGRLPDSRSRSRAVSRCRACPCAFTLLPTLHKRPAAACRRNRTRQPC